MEMAGGANTRRPPLRHQAGIPVQALHANAGTRQFSARKWPVMRIFLSSTPSFTIC
jgi:hypothetical protein